MPNIHLCTYFIYIPLSSGISLKTDMEETKIMLRHVSKDEVVHMYEGIASGVNGIGVPAQGCSRCDVTNNSDDWEGR